MNFLIKVFVDQLVRNRISYKRRAIYLLLPFFVTYYCCNNKESSLDYPLKISIVNTSKGKYMIKIKNKGSDYLLIRKYQNATNEPYFLIFNHLSFFSGTIENANPYQGPVPIADRMPLEKIDTIFVNEEKGYLFDPLYAGYISELTDFVLISFNITSSELNSMNEINGNMFYKKNNEFPIMHPFYIYQINDSFNFIESTKSFLRYNEVMFHK